VRHPKQLVVEGRHASSGMSTSLRAVAVADILAKTILLVLVILVMIEPAWGNLEGKAPVGRAIMYPLWAFVVPLVWAVRNRLRPAPFPWLPDLLLTLTCFTDVLGNRLDLYDSLFWFDDFMHFACTALVSAALVLLTERTSDRLLDTITRSVAFGLTASLVWELWEYVSFMTHSGEFASAYGDTLGDLSHGLLGAVLAAFFVDHLRGTVRRRAELRSY
jgi:hypothetical protein